MNRRVVAIGIAVAVIGAALWYVPLQPGATGDQSVDSFDRTIQLYAPFDVVDTPIHFSLSWATSYPVAAIVQLFACGSSSSCPHARSLGSEDGDEGSFSWTGSAGEYFLFESSVKPMTLDLRYTEPVLGGALGAGTVTFGAFLLVLGFFYVPARPVRSAVAPYGGASAPGPAEDAGTFADDPGPFTDDGRSPSR